MAFRTKLDYSDNRQINQRQRTFTNLEGGTVFGVPFSALTSGVDLTCSATTESYTEAISIFSGNATTTNYTWYDPRMSIAEPFLSAWTSSNSGQTQEANGIFTASSVTVIDGNSVTLEYTGMSFNLYVVTMVSLGPSSYSGTVKSDTIDVLSACSLDYTGRTIWIDNPEITRTKKLILTENPVVDYVWTCADGEGLGYWAPSSGGTSGITTDNFVSGGTYNSGTTTLDFVGTDPATTFSVDVSGLLGSGSTSLWSAGTGTDSAVLIGTTGDTGQDNTAYFKKAATDSISGLTFSSNTIDMNSGANQGIYIEHNGGASDTEYLKLDSTVELSRNSINKLTITNGAAALYGFSVLTLNVGNKSIFYGNNSGGNYYRTENIGAAGSVQAFQASEQGGNPVSSSSLHLGELQGEIIMGIPRAGFFDYDGVFGTGLGSQVTGTTGNEYQPVFISTPRAQARDTTSYDTIINSAFIGGSDNTMLTGVTGSVIAGGVNHTIEAGVENSVILGGSGTTATSSNAAYFENGVTDMITGYTWSGNTINMNDGANSPLTISHEDQLGGTEFLKLDSTVVLERSNSNYLSLSNGVGLLVASSQAILRTNNQASSFEARSAGAVIRSNSNFIQLTTVDAGGSPWNSTLQTGAMQSEFVTGMENTSVFPTGEFGTGLGSQITGTTGQEYFTTFISTPRSRTFDDISYSSIRNNMIAAGSNHSIYSAVTDSAILGGSGHTVNTGVVRSVILGGLDITATTNDMVYVPDLVIDGLTSTDPIATDANGKIVAGTSDRRLKKDIQPLKNGLDKILALDGVSYEYTEESNLGSGLRFGLIAQDVQKVIPEMVRQRAKGDGMLTLSYTEMVPWLIEAVKELASDDSPLIKREELILETQTIASEDNNIELNFNGTNDSALNGGMKVIKGINDTTDSEFKINSDGDWVTNNYVIPFGLVLPRYTPPSTNHEKGKLGEVTRDNDHIYIKTEDGWKRTRLETF